MSINSLTSAIQTLNYKRVAVSSNPLYNPSSFSVSVDTDVIDFFARLGYSHLRYLSGGFSGARIGLFEKNNQPFVFKYVSSPNTIEVDRINNDILAYHNMKPAIKAHYVTPISMTGYGTLITIYSNGANTPSATGYLMPFIPGLPFEKIKDLSPFSDSLHIFFSNFCSDTQPIPDENKRLLLSHDFYFERLLLRLNAAHVRRITEKTPPSHGSNQPLDIPPTLTLFYQLNDASKTLLGDSENNPKYPHPNPALLEDIVHLLSLFTFSTKPTPTDTTPANLLFLEDHTVTAIDPGKCGLVPLAYPLAKLLTPFSSLLDTLEPLPLRMYNGIGEILQDQCHSAFLSTEPCGKLKLLAIFSLSFLGKLFYSEDTDRQKKEFALFLKYFSEVFELLTMVRNKILDTFPDPSISEILGNKENIDALNEIVDDVLVSMGIE